MSCGQFSSTKWNICSRRSRKMNISSRKKSSGKRSSSSKKTSSRIKDWDLGGAGGCVGDIRG